MNWGKLGLSLFLLLTPFLLAAEGWLLETAEPTFGQVFKATYQGTQPLTGDLDLFTPDPDSPIKIIEKKWNQDSPNTITLTLQIFHAGPVDINFSKQSYLPPLHLELASLLEDPPPESLPHGIRAALTEPAPVMKPLPAWLLPGLLALIGLAFFGWWLSRKPASKEIVLDPWQTWLKNLDDLERLVLPDALWISHLLGALRDGLSLVLDQELDWATASEIRTTLQQQVPGWEKLEPLLGEADKIQFGAGELTKGSQPKLVRSVRQFVQAKRNTPPGEKP